MVRAREEAPALGVTQSWRNIPLSPHPSCSITLLALTP